MTNTVLDVHMVFQVSDFSHLTTSWSLGLGSEIHSTNPIKGYPLFSLYTEAPVKCVNQYLIHFMQGKYVFYSISVWDKVFFYPINFSFIFSKVDSDIVISASVNNNLI